MKLVTCYNKEGWIGLDWVEALHTTRANYDGFIMYHAEVRCVRARAAATKRARKTDGSPSVRPSVRRTLDTGGGVTHSSVYRPSFVKCELKI